MDCTIFKRLDIWPMTRGSTQICWELQQPATYFTGRYEFYVDFGQPATDEWVTLNELPIVDECCYYDLCQRNWGTMSTLYYRVRLVLPDEPDQPVYKSPPYRASGRLPRKQWLLARKIVSDEYLQLTKGGEGTQGFLLKRKQFGQACPVCLDWDTREIRDGDCPTCFGTGIVGGYYPGVDFYANFNAGWQRQLNDGQPPRGTTGDTVKQGRCLIYPFVDTRDVWVNVNNDERYIIRGWSTLAEVQGVPLIINAKFHLAPATSIVYSVPIEPDTSSSSVAPVEPAEPDVNRGLDATYEDW